jgi:hypothetical protein
VICVEVVEVVEVPTYVEEHFVACIHQMFHFPQILTQYLCKIGQ